MELCSESCCIWLPGKPKWVAACSKKLSTWLSKEWLDPINSSLLWMSSEDPLQTSDLSKLQQMSTRCRAFSVMVLILSTQRLLQVSIALHLSPTQKSSPVTGNGGNWQWCQSSLVTSDSTFNMWIPPWCGGHTLRNIDQGYLPQGLPEKKNICHDT